MSQDKFNTPWRLIANAIYSPAKDAKVFGTLDIDVTKADEYISEQRKSGNKITMTTSVGPSLIEMLSKPMPSN